MKIVLAVLGVLLVAAMAMLGWLGALTGVQVREQDLGPYPFVYVQDTTTDLKQVWHLTDALGKRLDAAGFTQRQPAQIYYPTGRGIQNQIGFIVDRTVPFELLGAETFFRTIPEQRYVAARFPFRNALSYVVGRFRVEPALNEYRKQKNQGETHGMVIHEGGSILYLQPVATGS
jgi:hypothetical protein